MAADDDWRADLGRWLEPPHNALRDPPLRRVTCPVYVAGLNGPSERKRVQLIAERLGLPGHDGLCHLVSVGAWDAEPLEAELEREADATP